MAPYAGFLRFGRLMGGVFGRQKTTKSPAPKGLSDTVHSDDIVEDDAKDQQALMLVETNLRSLQKTMAQIRTEIEEISSKGQDREEDGARRAQLRWMHEEERLELIEQLERLERDMAGLTERRDSLNVKLGLPVDQGVRFTSATTDTASSGSSSPSTPIQGQPPELHEAVQADASGGAGAHTQFVQASYEDGVPVHTVVVNEVAPSEGVGRPEEPEGRSPTAAVDVKTIVAERVVDTVIAVGRPYGRRADSGRADSAPERRRELVQLFHKLDRNLPDPLGVHRGALPRCPRSPRGTRAARRRAPQSRTLPRSPPQSPSRAPRHPSQPTLSPRRLRRPLNAPKPPRRFPGCASSALARPRRSARRRSPAYARDRAVHRARWPAQHVDARCETAPARRVPRRAIRWIRS